MTSVFTDAPEEPEEVRSFVVGQAVIAARPLPAALHLVATPIGNLGDVTLRALETLAGADVLACEDTRVTRTLLNRYGIRRKTLSYHEHNAHEVGPKLIAEIQAGRSVALASDAGTPLVSDPGFRLVEAAVAAGVPVVPIPGASAPLAALIASGLPVAEFFFAGFLPPKEVARRSRLDALKAVPGTLIFFESPQRLGASLASMAAVLGETRKAAVARELTKTFEEVLRATLGELAERYADLTPKGEIVVCVGPAEPDAPPEAEEVDALLQQLAEEMPASKAAAEAARRTGLPKSELFRRLVALKEDGGG
ncbi:MAG TPA: 16S rRNA (cytidine(1402)-2'-O)-methyltransferase [Mesorhizobium sp.]|jgi:16S rRNA (cytidine1402-2'-O)-methyltransferase|nr:16S rRNA (cytidine(1402)-2'-O)-methyltransferase [Mesorhizobium sp.]